MIEAFPVWLRVGHILNAILVIVLIRSGIEIFSAHPRLYKSDDNTESNLLIQFTKHKLPQEKIWTSDDEAESYNSFIALPGHANLGMGRHWHFLSVIFWPLNGATYWALLFFSGVWRTLIPTSPDVFPQAWQAFLMFLHGQLPPHYAGGPFDALQQLSYAVVVFVLGPLMIAIGAGMSPAIAASFPGYVRFFGGRQRLRIWHFAVMALFVAFIIVHVSLVVADSFQTNMADIILGGGQMSIGVATVSFILYLGVIFAVNFLANRLSLSKPRDVQDALGKIIEPVRKTLMGRVTSRQQLTDQSITCSYRLNGCPPETDEYRRLVASNFADWRLRVGGMVQRGLTLSLDDIRSAARTQQVTEHTCIQGWTGIAEWGGLRMSELMRMCLPLRGAKYAVFYSLAPGDLDKWGHGDPTTKFYEALPIEMARHDQTILAYEMNYLPLTIEHGAPLRLRVEVQYGYKMVKWLEAIEFVDRLDNIRGGRGGHREDSKYFDWGAWI